MQFFLIFALAILLSDTSTTVVREGKTNGTARNVVEKTADEKLTKIDSLCQKGTWGKNLFSHFCPAEKLDNKCRKKLDWTHTWINDFIPFSVVMRNQNSPGTAGSGSIKNHLLSRYGRNSDYYSN